MTTSPHIRSLWLQETLATETASPCPPLQQEIRADVCIVGGGYTGLWTALYLKEQSPALEIVLIERDICGGGASGRNAGYVNSYWMKFLSLCKVCGETEALRIARASDTGIDELRAFCGEHGIDADFRQDGWLWVATNPAQIGLWQETLAALAHHDEHPFDHWSAPELVQRTGSARHLAAVCERRAARIQPADLARGLRRVALARGVRIHEGTPLVDFTTGSQLRIRTPAGSVRADKLILAMNAWAIRWAEIRQSMVMVTGDVVYTAPIPERLAQIGWTDAIYVSDGRTLLNYYRTTRDARIVFGKGGMSGRFAYGGEVGNIADGASDFADNLEGWLHWTFPQLSDVPIAGSWRGPIDRTKSGLPFIGRLNGRDNIVFAAGFSGLGILPTRLAARMLGDLALERRSEWSECPLVRQPTRAFPPEPFRYVGSQLLRHALNAKDKAEDEGRAPGKLVSALASLAPAGMSPFKVATNAASEEPR